MKINENAFKKSTQCIVAYIEDTPAILWLNIENFKEIKKRTKKTISFDEDGISYTYVGTDKNGYAETKKKTPAITSYQLLDYEEAEKLGYIQQFTDISDIKNDDKKRGYIQQFKDILDEDEDDNWCCCCNEDEDDEYRCPHEDDNDIHCTISYVSGGGSHNRHSSGSSSYSHLSPDEIKYLQTHDYA